ncbi:MAG: hypothetical protein D6744_10130, partial [Planctomycetota bacterium]
MAPLAAFAGDRTTVRPEVGEPPAGRFKARSLRAILFPSGSDKHHAAIRYAYDFLFGVFRLCAARGFARRRCRASAFDRTLHPAAKGGRPRRRRVGGKRSA